MAEPVEAGLRPRYAHSMDHRSLHRRLQRARVLAERGATAGERRAAREAAARLEARLQKEGPTASAARWEADDGLDPALSPGPASVVPSTATLRSWVLDWQQGSVQPGAIARVARGLVDRVVLPDRPSDDPLSVRVEVVMLMTSLGSRPLDPADAPALLSFLSTGEVSPEEAWRAWFRHLERRVSPAVRAS